MDHVIIGNGIAGVGAAEAIRRIDGEARITLIGDETFPPYCRPMISLVLEGAATVDRLPIRGDRFHRDMAVTPVLGERVTAVDTANRKVRVGAGREIPYDRLLIATGADPRPIQAEGVSLSNIFYMRTEAQVRGMVSALPAVRHALVLGGGLVGFKAAYSLLRRGVRVTILIRSAHPLSMQADEVAGALVLEELRKHGLDVRTGIAVTAFEGNGRVARAHLSDGTTLPCDLAVIGKGVLPALDFLDRDRVDVDLGVLVDEHMETSAPGVYAAGDAAESTDIARRSRWVNAIWPEAVLQGRAAGMNMAGRRVAYPGSLSRNVIRVFDLDIMTGGVVTPGTGAIHEVFRDKGLRTGTYRKLIFREDRLVGFVLVNDIEQGGVLLSLIQNRRPIRPPRDRMLSPGFNFKLAAGM